MRLKTWLIAVRHEWFGKNPDCVGVYQVKKLHVILWMYMLMSLKQLRQDWDYICDGAQEKVV